MHMLRIWKDLILAYIGGMLYVTLEHLWRGWSHPSMFLLGGLCFLLLGALNEHPATAGVPLLWQSILGAGIVTVLELVTGLIVNVALDLNVWDYSALPFNFMGQICLYFFLLWIPVSTLAILADDAVRHLLFHEPWPHYRLI